MRQSGVLKNCSVSEGDTSRKGNRKEVLTTCEDAEDRRSLRIASR